MNAYDKSAQKTVYKQERTTAKQVENLKQSKTFRPRTSKMSSNRVSASSKPTVQLAIPNMQNIKSHKNKVNSTNTNLKKSKVHSSRQQSSAKKTKHFGRHTNRGAPQVVKRKHAARRVLPAMVRSKIKTFLLWSARLPTILKWKKYNDDRALKNCDTFKDLALSVRTTHNRVKKINNKKSKLVLLKKKVITSLAVINKKSNKNLGCSALQWKKNTRKHLFKSFLTAVKTYITGVGQKETQNWKHAQRARLARWLVINTQRRGVKKTNLLERAYIRMHWLKNNASPEEARTLAVIRIAEVAALREQPKNLKSRHFMQMLIRLRKKLIKWLKVRRQKKQTVQRKILNETDKRNFRILLWKCRLRKKNRRKALRKILKPLLHCRYKGYEQKLAKIVWLFLSPDVLVRPLSKLLTVRTALRNRKKNRWRKIAGEAVKIDKEEKQIADTKKMIQQMAEHSYNFVTFDAIRMKFNIYEKVRVKQQPPLIGKITFKSKKRWFGRRWPRRIRKMRLRRYRRRKSFKKKMSKFGRHFRKKMKKTVPVIYKKMLNITQKTRKYTRLNTSFFTVFRPTTSTSFRLFSTTTLKAKKKIKPQVLKRHAWFLRFRKNLKKNYHNKASLLTSQKSTHYPLPTLFKIKKGQETASKKNSALRSHRTQKKLKKLEKTRQCAGIEKQKYISRRFLSMRLFIENNRTPQLLSVRKSAKQRKLKINLTNTRTYDKKIFAIARKKNKINKNFSFAAVEAASLSLNANALKIQFQDKEKKFIRRWSRLLRNSKSKKRAWKKLISKRALKKKLNFFLYKPLIKKIYKNLQMLRRQKKSNRQLRANKTKLLSASKINKWKKTNNRRAAQKVKKQVSSYYLRANRKFLSANFRFLALQKLRRKVIASLFSYKLKQRRSGKKNLFRKNVKKSVNSRRRRWFKKNIVRAIRRKKPRHLKPWERKPRNPIFKKWGRLLYKRFFVQNKRNLFLISNKIDLNKKKYFAFKQKLLRKNFSAAVNSETAVKKLIFLRRPLLLKKLKNLMKQQKKITREKKEKSALYFTPFYRVKAKLQNKKNRRGITKAERKTRDLISFRRLQSATKIQNARKKVNATHKKMLKPFKSLAIVTRAEKRKKQIGPVKRRNRRKIKRRVKLISRPSTTGVTRRRHTFNSTTGRLTSLLHYRTSRALWKRGRLSKIAAHTIKEFKRMRLKVAVLPLANKKNKSTAVLPLKKNVCSVIKLKKSKKIKVFSRRQRTPGAGRVKNTFESSLRKQQQAVLPTYYKNKDINKIKQSIQNKQLQYSSELETTTQRRWGDRQLAESTAQAYQSAPARSVSGSKRNFDKTGKFGFAKTAIKMLNRATMAAVRKQKQKLNIGNTGLNETLLKAALYRRRLVRQARNLRRIARKNKIVRVKVRPFWLRWRYVKKLRRARAAKLYSIAEDTRFVRPEINKWTVNELGVGISRKRKRTAKLKTLAGETIKATQHVKRIVALTYVQKKLKKKKRKLLKMQRLSKIKKILRLRKKKEHRAVRAIKMIFSRFRKHGRRKLRVLKLWKKRKLYKVERKIRRVVKKRTRYSKTLRQLSLRSITNLLVKTTKAKETLEKSIKNTREKTVLLTPLYFKKPANQLTASTEENKKWKRHVQAMQKQKYGRLENVSDALTKIIPNVISMLLERNKIKLTKTQTNQAIVAAYWNLRLLIQQAYRSKKFSVADLNPAKLVRLKQELMVRARCQFFDMSAVKKTRYRFQPHRLITAPSLKQGAEDWIRQYLPKFYDLYLEDAEKYKHLMITPIKIFRAHPNCAAIRSWETRANPSTIEAQFKRLTQGVRGRSSSRFENMLITAKRHPLINGREHAASASVLTGTNSQPRWNSFFKRDYGSYLQQNRKVANRVVSALKWMPLDENREAPRGLLTAYKLVKSRNVAKSKIRHISENETEINGVVDFRLSRQKSPRNSEFIERLADHSSQVHEKTFLSYKESVRKKILKTLNAEKSSRTARIVTHAEPDFLRKVRKQAITRRSATFVKNKKLASEKLIPPVEQKRLNGYNIENRELQYKQRVLKGAVNRPLQANHSILHNRNPSKIKKTSIETPTLVVPARAFQIRKQLRSRSRKLGLNKKIANRKATKKNYFYHKIEKTTPVKKAKTKLSRTKINFTTVRAEKKKMIIPAAFLTSGRKKTYFPKKQTIFNTKRIKTKRIQKIFIKRFKLLRVVNKRISKLAIKERAKGGVSLWAVRRKELWHQLTSRWMKKRRILRRWLKGIKYSFKEKNHWTFEGEHALPDELFKLSRSRLRKLEWKKADGKFEYIGLKKKLTLRPTEKRTAPWLEGLLYSRALYSTRRLAIRRYQLPKDQKSKKWLQKAKKQLFRKPTTHMYIKRKSWARLRMYNQRLNRSLFNIRNTKVAVKRFQKLNRKKTRTTGFEIFTKGHFDRADVNLISMKFAPSTFWSREMANSGLLSINGKAVTNRSTRLVPGDRISWDNGLLKIYRNYFKSHFNKWEKYKELEESSRRFPSNMHYVSKLGTLTYTRHPRASDISPRGRVNRLLFSWFRLDSRLGR